MFKIGEAGQKMVCKFLTETGEVKKFIKNWHILSAEKKRFVKSFEF